LFAAFLGYNPLATILPPQIIKALPAAAQADLLGKTFFPNLLSGPFESGLRIAFIVSTLLMLVAALASLVRAEKGPQAVEETAEPSYSEGSHD
jgi:hypothetical protein